jgi:hypothetical protein
MKSQITPLRKYGSYALAAAALGSAPAASAAIIHVDPTDTTYTSESSTPFDLNSDGVIDYILHLAHGTSPSDYAFVHWAPQGTNYNLVNVYGLPAPVVAGTSIELFVPDDPFHGGLVWNTESLLWGKQSGNVQGQLSNFDLNTSFYMGLMFDISGEYHFGWVRLAAAGEHGVQASAIIHEWAYESVAGRAIPAGATVSDPDGSSDVPEPSSLALFALGAAGIAAFKRLRRNP